MEAADARADKEGSVRSKNAKNPRPSMQIYRPPGLRGSVTNKSAGSRDSDQASNASSASSKSSARSAENAKLSANELTQHKSSVERPPQSQRQHNSSHKAQLSKATAESPPAPNSGNNSTTQSAQSQRQQQQQKISSSTSTTTTSAAATATAATTTAATKMTKLKVEPKIIEQHKTRTLPCKGADEIRNAFGILGLSERDEHLFNEFLDGEMTNDSLARDVGATLARHAIEHNNKRQSGRAVARLCGSILVVAPTASAFHAGLFVALAGYSECRAVLRAERPRAWINLLGFVPDLYASLSVAHEGGLVDVIFDIFNYMLKPATLESLKIEELECMMGALLSVGYELERHRPDQLGQLQDAIRDAFVNARESWTRKMLLLMIELGASGWQLAPDAHEYYFQ